jgi:outer membrane protein OmpA-like peptidoglycan-associated protein
MMRLRSRGFPASYRYSRYSYGRTGRLRWVLVGLGLLCCVAAAYTYVHRGPASIPAKYVIAASGTANEPRPGLPGDLTQKLQTAGQSSTDAKAYVVNPGTGVATYVSLTPRLSNGQVDYGPTRDATLAASISRVQQVLGAERASGPFDLISTITAATRAVPPPATLILVSSGLSTSGGLDFRQAGWVATPSSLAAQLESHHLLPSLNGYHVVFSGLGVVDGRQPVLPLPAQDVVKNYWMAICQVAGAASCRVDDTTRAVLPSLSQLPVPLVSPRQGWIYKGQHGSLTAKLPDALLFSFDSAALLSSADGILQPLVKRAQRHHLLVSITGSASPDGGTPAYNLALSQRRAQAVRNRLVALGLPASWITKVTGLGTDGHGPGACLVHGQLSEARCAKLRQVVISMTPYRNQS